MLEQEVVSTEQQFTMKVYLYVHNALRKEINALEQAVQRPVRPTIVSKLTIWFDFYVEMLEAHHHLEDGIDFPLITARASEFHDELDELTQDHHRLEEIVTQVRQTLAHLRDLKKEQEQVKTSQQLRQGIGLLRLTLEGHLDREEAIYIPAISKYFTVADQKQLGNRHRKAHSMQHLSLLVPWIISKMTPEQQKATWSENPWIMHFLYRVAWKRKYDKFVAAFAISS